MASRPLIGIIACTRPFGGETAQVVIDRYMEAVVRHADVDAVLIPARPNLVDAVAIAARLDGLLLTGSPSNVAPSRYDDDSEGSGPFDYGRDEMVLRLIEAMIARSRPVLGICRGFQEVNVAFGGTLARDLGHQDRVIPHHAPDGASLDAMFAHGHDVMLTPGGVLEGAFGRERMQVNSVHFQGVATLGNGLSVEAAAADGVIEAVSAAPNGAPILAIQWHPEWQTDRDAASQGIFQIFGRALRGETQSRRPGAGRAPGPPGDLDPGFRRNDEQKSVQETTQ